VNPFSTFQRRADSAPGTIDILAMSADMARGQTFTFSEAGKLVKTTDRVNLADMNGARAAAGFEPIKHYQMEFEDFDPADMPELPPGFDDCSWHNDLSPSFEHQARGLQLWVDYADPELREFPEGERFTVFFMTGVGYGERLSDEPAFVSNEWAAVEKWLAEEADTARLAMLASDDARLARIVGEKAVELIALEVQKALQVPSGDMASLFFHENEERMVALKGMVSAYIAVERAAAKIEGGEA
jgi:hypothetical protein